MNTKQTKIIFMGTPGFAQVVLEKIFDSGYDIRSVITQTDKKSGRQQKVVYSPVKKLALEKDLKIIQPRDLNDPYVCNEIASADPDLIIVAAFGKILPKKILDIPRFGCINIHASLLPKWRGASPIQNAILAGEEETGVTLMLMNEKMDEGKIIALEKIGIKKDENTESLSERLANVSSELLIKNIPYWIAGKIKAKKQDELHATYCLPIKKKDGKIDWKRSAEEIYRRFLAYQVWPGIWTEIKAKNGSKRLKLIEIRADINKDSGENIGKVVKCNQSACVQTGKGLIAIEKVQLEGKKSSEMINFLRGNINFIGSQLS
jgi:methionyl-tRNA formyltransferase